MVIVYAIPSHGAQSWLTVAAKIGSFLTVCDVKYSHSMMARISEPINAYNWIVDFMALSPEEETLFCFHLFLNGQLFNGCHQQACNGLCTFFIGASQKAITKAA
jgi:hypothetical protein